MAARGRGDPCPCNNIVIMQLFHELKQKFPAVPDRVVSECIRQNCHDKGACESLLRRENQGYLMHSYPMALKLSVAGDETPTPSGKPCERCSAATQTQRFYATSREEGDVASETTTQWFAQGAQYLGGDSDVDACAFDYPRFEDLTFTSGSAQYQHVERKRSPFPQTDEGSSPVLRRGAVHDDARCMLQETHSQCETRSSVSVQQSSTTFHRPRPLDLPSWPAPDVPPKSRTSLSVEPAPHYNHWGGATGTVVTPSRQPRSYTSVNLTLRPPSLDPLPPIDIHSAGTSLTYSTSSYDPRQGFQSQLQIRIGPGGVGSVSALRTRGPEARPRSCFVPAIEMREETPTRAESLPDVASLSLDNQESSPEDSLGAPVELHSMTHALLAQQLARKERLVRELRREKQKLREMQREVRTMEHDLAQRQLRQRAAHLALPVVTSVLEKVQCLRQEIQYLQEECKKMTTEVDLSADAHGQETRGPSSPLDALDLDGPNWTCTECTFRNHPLLDKCEQCEMPRIILGGETQDIHIHVTHHNFPARRVLHSWVV